MQNVVYTSARADATQCANCDRRTKMEIKTTISNVSIPPCVTEEQFYAVMGNIYTALAGLYGEEYHAQD